MRNFPTWFLLLNLLFFNPLNAQITLPHFFGSNMVLPRDKAIPIAGKATPNEQLKISIREQRHIVKADADGDWKIVLSPLEVGEPAELKIEGKNSLVLTNILIGDLWLCSGQSNMQYTLDMLRYEEKEPLRADMPNLRLFTVQVETDYLPRKDISGGEWKVANAQSARNFSGTAYFFGRHLIENQDIPIGLISSNLGATAIETWMSIDALKQLPQFDDVTSKILNTNKSFQTLNEELKSFRESWDNDHYLQGPGMKEKWYADDYDYSDWKECETPIFWEYLGFENHDGSFWFRKEFELTEDQVKQDLWLNLNQIDDYDITWVNGQQVGETFGQSNFRNYIVPKSILRAGKNSLTIRVFDVGGLGGIYTSAFWGNPILNGKWKYKHGKAIDASNFPKPEVANGSPFSHPALLYNANIAPLHDLPITGVIWYQGESNESRAVEYEQLLKTMIKDWRQKWNNESLPFLIVQLANHHKEDELPKNSNWAELRAAQHKATDLNKVDIMTAIDIGDAYDIHPRNKMDVGKRLGLLAMHYSYGAKLKKGPAYQSHRIENGRMIIKMNTFGSGLKSLDKYGYLRGFALAGSDGKFHWAKAKIISKDEVEVFSDVIKQPLYVRYAWSDNPGELDLVNEELLPAFPFRTDDFKLGTQDRKYKYDPHAF